MDIVILGLLMVQDLTVYQLNQAFKSGIALIYSASYGSILSAIKKLLELKEITFIELVENGRNKKIYHITAAGIAHFFQWMHADIDGNKLETMALCKVFFLGLIDSDDEKRKILENIISAIINMEESLNQLSQYLSQLQLSDEEKKLHGYQFKTLDYGIRSHGVAREWAQELLDELSA
ncbi:MAG TPA: PadR family transcriptional regulator [Anaerolineaceae bacterium]|nr:PadR family transcriptional regulator [Anaerolineaceae bacterium]